MWIRTHIVTLLHQGKLETVQMSTRSRTHKLYYSHNQIIIWFKGQRKGNKLLTQTAYFKSIWTFCINFRQVFCLCVFVCVHINTCVCARMFMWVHVWGCGDQRSTLHVVPQALSNLFFKMYLSLIWSSLITLASQQAQGCLSSFPQHQDHKEWYHDQLFHVGFGD